MSSINEEEKTKVVGDGTEERKHTVNKQNLALQDSLLIRGKHQSNQRLESPSLDEMY